MNQRLAEMVWTFLDGDDAVVVAWLCSLGCRLVSSDPVGGEWTLDGVSGIRCGIYRGIDPITVAVQFGFLLFGMFWSEVCPGLLDDVKKEWTARKKHEKMSGMEPAR